MSITVLLAGLALIFGSYTALKESTFAARSCFVTSLIMFVLAVMGAFGSR